MQQHTLLIHQNCNIAVTGLAFSPACCLTFSRLIAITYSQDHSSDCLRGRRQRAERFTHMSWEVDDLPFALGWHITIQWGFAVFHISPVWKLCCAWNSTETSWPSVQWGSACCFVFAALCPFEFFALLLTQCIWLCLIVSLQPQQWLTVFLLLFLISYLQLGPLWFCMNSWCYRWTHEDKHMTQTHVSHMHCWFYIWSICSKL